MKIDCGLRPMAEIGKDIIKAKKILESGGLVAIPTETVYGLAANALDEKAVMRIFEAKQRPSFDPLISHVSSSEKIEALAESMPEKARMLANKHWPGPLTLLLNKKSIIPDIVTSGLSSAAFRVPSHELTCQLLDELSFPLAAPSANPFGYISPTKAKHVQDQLGNQIDYILDGGEAKVGVESTIVGFNNNRVTVHRLGGLSIEEIEETIGEKVKLQINNSSNPSAPGMLKSHYAPKKPLFIGDIRQLISEHRREKIGVISFKDDYATQAHVHIALSGQGDVKEAAQNLFSALRTMDYASIDVILTEFLPEQGLGRAVNDRLKRASA